MREYSVRKLTIFRRCQREYRHEYVDKLGAEERSPALDFGLAWGRAMQSRGNGHEPLLAITAFDELEPYHRAMWRALFYGYQAKYAGDNLPYIFTEKEFSFDRRANIDSPIYRFRGRIDAGVKVLRTLAVKQHEQALVEYKTTGQDIGPGSVYWRRLELDTQTGLYRIAGRLMGAGGFWHDVVRKPNRPPLKASENVVLKKDGEPRKGQRTADETPNEYEERLVDYIGAHGNETYARTELIELRAERGQVEKDLFETIDNIEAAHSSNRFPRNPDACARFGTMCPYFRLCTNQANMSDFEVRNGI